MKRWAALLIGLGLIGVAFAAATHVADTREGLIAEVITLFAALAGVSLTIYGLVSLAAPRATPPSAAGRPAPGISTTPPVPAVRPLRDLVTGVAGLCVAAVLVTGLVLSAGLEWAVIAGVMLLPMLAGSAYLCYRFFKAPARSWRLEPRKPSPER